MSKIYQTKPKLKCSCGKISFDKRGAQTKKNALEKRGKEKELRIYQCPDSNTWHLTSTLKWDIET